MTSLTIALLQLTPVGSDQAANLAKGDAACRRAAAMGADIALFPEMWNIGYTSYAPPSTGASDLWRAPQRWNGQAEAPDLDRTAARQAWQARAISRDDPFIQHFRRLARELGMAIAITYLEAWSGAPRNSVSLIDRHGEIGLTYAKIHTCDFDAPEAACTPGDDFHMCTLDTAQGEVKVGAMICFDREFPESARILMLKGAEIILTPNSCDLDRHRIEQFRARAFENMVGVAMANYAAPRNNGHSVAFDPITFDADGKVRDNLVVEAGEGEGVYLAAFDLDQLRRHRSSEVWGNAFRRSHRYAALTASAIEPPFVRVDAAGRKYDPTER
jgi:N-carbamoylputrescine amidase